MGQATENITSQHQTVLVHGRLRVIWRDTLSLKHSLRGALNKTKVHTPSVTPSYLSSNAKPLQRHEKVDFRR